MFRVQDFMTRSPICVDPDEKITAVIDLMHTNRIHRIPVVDKDDVLVGLITEGMITSQSNSATSLSIYELNYLLAKTKVKTLMERRPKYIHENALMEEATDKMLRDDIGCLPVVNDQKKVVGILTQNDIFTAFLEMLGWSVRGTRMIVSVTDSIGALARLSEVFADCNVDIRNVGVYSIENGMARILIKTKGEASEELREKLEETGFHVKEWSNY